MKTIIFILLLIVPALAFAQPSITFEEESYDFGIVKRDEPLEHTFEVLNSGIDELVITRLDAP